VTSPDVPAERRVLDELRRQILSGELPGGARLRSIRQLAEQYDIDKNVAERIVTELRNAGLVETRRGSGIFVRAFAAIPRSSPSRLAKDRWLGGQTIQDADTGRRTRSVDVETGERPAPPWATDALGLTRGAPAAFRRRRYSVDDRIVQLSTSYLPVEIARGTVIMHTDSGPGGTYARLAELGYAPTHFTEYVRARMPLPDEVERLSLPAGTPVIEITRHAFDQDNTCVEVNRMILDGMAYLLDYSFPA
jgi:GntR family transcriptional regulator